MIDNPIVQNQNALKEFFISSSDRLRNAYTVTLWGNLFIEVCEAAEVGVKIILHRVL